MKEIDELGRFAHIFLMKCLESPGICINPVIKENKFEMEFPYDIEKEIKIGYWTIPGKNFGVVMHDNSRCRFGFNICESCNFKRLGESGL